MNNSSKLKKIKYLVKPFLVITVAVIILSSWYLDVHKTKNAFEYLKKMTILKIEIRGEYESIENKAARSKDVSHLSISIKECLAKLESIPDVRLGEELNWAKIAFIGDNQEHHIAYAVTKNKTVLLGGGFYAIKNADMEIEYVGLGSSMKSTCLSEIINQI
jgi:hypothetical protein